MKKLLKTKYGILLVMMIPLGLSLITACKKNENKITPNIVLGISDTLYVPNLGGTKSIVFVSNIAWEASSDVDWISIANTSGGKGKDTLQFTVDANNGDERTGKIMISSMSGDFTKEIKVVQASGISRNFFVKEGKSGEGHSWADATSLQKALEQAVDGDTIFVAAGTYYPSKIITNGDPGDEGDKTFEISKNITIIGGYPADATLGASADPSTNKTILSGDLGGGNTAYHVVAVSAPKVNGLKVTLVGLTITEGNASNKSTKFDLNGTTFYRNDGGGMIIGNANVEINNCEIINNHSQYSNAGIFINGGAEVIIRNSKVNKNIASGGNGAGIWVYGSSILKVYNCEISENIAKGGVAGAVYVYMGSKLFLYNTTVAHNECTSYGAAVYLRDKSEGVLINCLIYDNSSTSPNGGGGLMMYDNCDATIISSTITKNNIAGPGGGVYRRSGDNKLSIYNSIISGNTQKDNGRDVDVYETSESQPVIKASVIGSKVYDINGLLLTNTTFDVNNMLNAQFIPIGTDNPALTKGMSAEALSGVGADIYPPLDEDYIKSDMKGTSRSGATVMGALLP
ncbi:MAG: right-handed parallel beta-helix repeat-containing protein [Thermoflavifilum aggregans]|nr:right-handed parallel beta-helix repeat-containing protein [Thermoflavifilum aggregans]